MAQNSVCAVSILENACNQQTLLFSVSNGCGEHPKKLRSMLLKAPYNMINVHFPALHLAFVDNPLRLSSMQLTGVLLSATAGLCGQTFPADILAGLCAESLQYDRLRDLLRVCCCYFPALELVELHAAQAPDANTSRTSSSSSSRSSSSSKLKLERHLHTDAGSGDEEEERAGRTAACEAEAEAEAEAEVNALVDSLRSAVLEARCSDTDTRNSAFLATPTPGASHTSAKSKVANPFSRPLLDLWLRGLWALNMGSVPACEEVSMRIAALSPAEPAAAQRIDTCLLLDARFVLTKQLQDREERTRQQALQATELDLPTSIDTYNLKTNMHAKIDADAKDIPVLYARHAWAVMCLAEALGAMIPLVACMTALTSPRLQLLLHDASAPEPALAQSNKMLFPSGWSGAFGAEVMQGAAHALEANAHIKQRAHETAHLYARVTEVFTSQVPSAVPTSEPRPVTLLRTAFAEKEEDAQENASDTSSDSGSACTDGEAESPPPPEGVAAAHSRVTRSSAVSLHSQAQARAGWKSPDPSLPASGYTTAQNSPIDEEEEEEEEEEDLDLTSPSPTPTPMPIRMRASTPTSALRPTSLRTMRGSRKEFVSPCTPPRVWHVGPTPLTPLQSERIEAQVAVLLHTPTSALSTRSSRSKQRAPTVDRGVELLQRASPRPFAHDCGNVHCEEEKRIAGKDSIDSGSGVGCAVDSSSNSTIFANLSNSFILNAACTPTNATSTSDVLSRYSHSSAERARDMAAQRVRQHIKEKKEAEEKALADSSLLAARLQTLDRQVSAARQTVPSRYVPRLSRSAEKPNREHYVQQTQARSHVHKTKTKEMEKEKEEDLHQEKELERRKEIDFARRRAVQRVKEHRTRALSSAESQLLRSVEPDSAHPFGSFHVTASAGAGADTGTGTGIATVTHADAKSPAPWSIGSPRPRPTPASAPQLRMLPASSRTTDEWVLAPPTHNARPSPLPSSSSSSSSAAAAVAAKAAISASQDLLLGQLLLESPQVSPPASPLRDVIATAIDDSPDTAGAVAGAGDKAAAVTSEIIPVAEEPCARSSPVYVLVLRASGLVEGLGGCNPYAVLSWGDLGHGRTDTVSYSTSPSYMQSLKFRSPIVQNGPSAELLTALGEDLHVNWVPDGTSVQVFLPALKVSIYSANMSVSDELLARGEVDAYQLLDQPVVHTIPLFDVREKPAGTIELQFMFNKC